MLRKSEIDEPVKMAFTSLRVDTRLIVIYKDGGVKIVDPIGEDSKATAMYIYREELQEILKHLPRPQTKPAKRQKIVANSGISF